MVISIVSDDDRYIVAECLLYLAERAFDGKNASGKSRCGLCGDDDRFFCNS